ncbi:MAG: NlpC/P60 family protein [Candidatus Cloacimonadota bacterium]|nr:MAG: NlpC/P60 family protein [Candidatus Cloacimonadota bacterium]
MYMKIDKRFEWLISIFLLFLIGCSSARFSSQHLDFALKEDEKDLRKEIVIEALKQRGVRYLYGGSSPSGFDCSGFVQYVYKKFGIDLPRTVKAMEKEGKWVKRDDFIAGDLVIFHNPRHVGIYAGKGKFVHASSSRGVVLDRLDKEYYRKRFVGGKNIISDLFF